VAAQLKDAGACKVTPCPSDSVFLLDLCQCVVRPDTGPPADLQCERLPCPLGAKWNPSTCACDSSLDAGVYSCPASTPLDSRTNACTLPDIPDPPPYCVAPCVWEMVKRCLPVKQACTQATSPGDTKFCQLDTEWSLEHSNNSSDPVNDYYVRIKGSRGDCYNAGAVWDEKPTKYTTDYNGRALQINDGPVVCASTDELQARGLLPLPAELPPDIVTYTLDRTRAECAAWDEYGVPVTPCDATPGNCGIGQ
jgi:hypothetical protein